MSWRSRSGASRQRPRVAGRAHRAGAKRPRRSVSSGRFHRRFRASRPDGAARRRPKRVDCRPVGTLFFVLGFVLLGLATLLIAMSRGRGGLDGMLHSQTRGSRRFATFFFVAALIGLGVIVPAAVIATDRNSDDIPSAGISNLTAEEKHGQE